jgi:hypothetical protein
MAELSSNELVVDQKYRVTPKPNAVVWFPAPRVMIFKGVYAADPSYLRWSFGGDDEQVIERDTHTYMAAPNNAIGGARPRRRRSRKSRRNRQRTTYRSRKH